MTQNHRQYCLTTNVRDDDRLRASFNELTEKTFGFDFTGWYDAGFWGELYIPHALTDGSRVVSNVSVNLMCFELEGEIRNYIQLGTVMTDPDYRGLGLNRKIMEHILKKYENSCDGIYLFGNDSVLDYYPRFGFRPCGEYEYSFIPAAGTDPVPYRLEKTDPADTAQQERFFEAVRREAESAAVNENDGFYMRENLGLYQFWTISGYGNSIFFLPEEQAYVLADKQEHRLLIHQVIGRQPLDYSRLAASFGAGVTEVVFGYTPACRESLTCHPYREEDCTLFVLGRDPDRVERDRLHFPALSHA